MRRLSTGQVSIAAGMLVLAGTTWGSSGPGTDDLLAAPGAAEKHKAGAHYKDMYGIVNLVSLPGFGLDVNARGQAAFEYTAFDDERIRVGFFNGERITDISPPNHVVTLLGALNEKGDVALQARFSEPGNEVPTAFQPFRWSSARGLVPLRTFSPEAETFVYGINNRGELAGISGIGPGNENFRAARWTAANRSACSRIPERRAWRVRRCT